MPSLFSQNLEPAMQLIFNDTIDDISKANDAEASFLGLNGAGKPINSKGKYYPVWNTYNASGKYKTEGGNYGVPNGSKLLTMRAGITNYTLSSSYTNRFLRQLENADAKVMVESYEVYKERDRRIILDNLAQDQWGDGSGIKAIVTSVTSGVVLCTKTVASGCTFGVMKLMDGERLNFINPATGAVRAGGGPSVGTIAENGVNNPSTTFTLTGSSGTDYPNDIAPGDYVVREDSYGQSITGLLRAANNDSLDIQGLNRGTYRKTRASVYDAGGAPPSFPNINVLKYKMKSRATNKDIPRDLCCSFEIEQLIENLGHPMRRYTEVTKVQDTGFNGFKIDGAMAMSFMYVPADMMFSVDRSVCDWNVMEPLHVVNRDGSIFRMAPTTTGTYSDNYLVFWELEADLGYSNFRNLGRMQNYDISSAERTCDNADL